LQDIVDVLFDYLLSMREELPMKRLTRSKLTTVVLCAYVLFSLQACDGNVYQGDDGYAYQDVTMPDGFHTKVRLNTNQLALATMGSSGNLHVTELVGEPNLVKHIRMPDGFWLLCADGSDCTEDYQEYLPWHSAK